MLTHLVIWWITHSHMTMHWFIDFSSPPSLLYWVGTVMWRNPLNRHFSFPLTDRPWRPQAFRPPSWLAARQLNKLSSCYNSLKHFQLPQSNKSCRQAFGRFSTNNPTSQRPSTYCLVYLDIPHATVKRKHFSGQVCKTKREIIGNNMDNTDRRFSQCLYVCMGVLLLLSRLHSTTFCIHYL